MNLEEEVKNRLENSLENAEIMIDFSDGKHMTVEIASKSFAGIGLIDQHKLVYAALGDLIKDGYLHALKLKTKAA
jgi:stress-induced morphogen